MVGNGLRAELNGSELVGGNQSFIRSVVSVSEEISEKADALAEEGKTPLFFAADGKLVGVIAVADTMKEDRPQAIRELKNLGLKVVMLTGDNERTAKAIGRKAGVDEVIAGVFVFVAGWKLNPVFEKVPIDFVILETVFLVSILSRVFISRQFEEYVRQTQKKQADAITLEKTDIDIYSLAKEIIQGFKIGFEEKKIDVKLYGEETHVFADRKRAAWASAFRFQKQL
jgi:hypothetical protein